MRETIIKIDIAMDDNEEIYFITSIDEVFISHFNVDVNTLKEGINKFIEENIIDK